MLRSSMPTPWGPEFPLDEHHPDRAKSYASLARSIHDVFGLVTESHSFVSRPCPGSNGLPM
jgi:hypothetical protein